jgi:ATP-dependent RNA helicase RhlE
MPLPARLLARLAEHGFVTPTPIQEMAIPVAMAGRDVVGIAQTGTGKTLAFGIPIAARLRPGYSALILAPTRELAEQIEETLEKLGLTTALLIGGKAYEPQFKALRRGPQAIIATPGRLRDLMNKGTVDLQAISMLILDEADRMLDMGFADAIDGIYDALEDDCQVMLFSATMPGSISTLSEKYLTLPVRLEAAPPGTPAAQLDQELIVCAFEEKPAILKEILEETEGTILVFARTRMGAAKLAEMIRGWGHEAAEIHADLSQGQRRLAMDGFRQGRVRILVATDIAARGIDVKGIELVINHDLPDNPSDYIHRIGRTGRAGESGKALTFALPHQRHEVRSIEFLIKRELPRSPRSTGDIRAAGVPGISRNKKGRPGSKFRKRAFIKKASAA